MSDLVSQGVPIRGSRSEAARDVAVVVALVGGGGLITYEKPDGRQVHTLNTPAGFARKLEQLGLELPRSD